MSTIHPLGLGSGLTPIVVNDVGLNFHLSRGIGGLQVRNVLGSFTTLINGFIIGGVASFEDSALWKEVTNDSDLVGTLLGSDNNEFTLDASINIDMTELGILVGDYLVLDGEKSYGVAEVHRDTLVIIGSNLGDAVEDVSAQILRSTNLSCKADRFTWIDPSDAVGMGAAIDSATLVQDGTMYDFTSDKGGIFGFSFISSASGGLTFGQTKF